MISTSQGVAETVHQKAKKVERELSDMERELSEIREKLGVFLHEHGSRAQAILLRGQDAVRVSQGFSTLYGMGPGGNRIGGAGKRRKQDVGLFWRGLEEEDSVKNFGKTGEEVLGFVGRALYELAIVSNGGQSKAKTGQRPSADLFRALAKQHEQRLGSQEQEDESEQEAIQRDERNAILVERNAMLESWLSSSSESSSGLGSHNGTPALTARSGGTDRAAGGERWSDHALRVGENFALFLAFLKDFVEVFAVDLQRQYQAEKPPPAAPPGKNNLSERPSLLKLSRFLSAVVLPETDVDGVDVVPPSDGIRSSTATAFQRWEDGFAQLVEAHQDKKGELLNVRQLLRDARDTVKEALSLPLNLDHTMDHGACGGHGERTSALPPFEDRIDRESVKLFLSKNFKVPLSAKAWGGLRKSASLAATWAFLLTQRRELEKFLEVTVPRWERSLERTAVLVEADGEAFNPSFFGTPGEVPDVREARRLLLEVRADLDEAVEEVEKPKLAQWAVEWEAAAAAERRLREEKLAKEEREAELHLAEKKVLEEEERRAVGASAVAGAEQVVAPVEVEKRDEGAPVREKAPRGRGETKEGATRNDPCSEHGGGETKPPLTDVPCSSEKPELQRQQERGPHPPATAVDESTGVVRKQWDRPTKFLQADPPSLTVDAASSSPTPAASVAAAALPKMLRRNAAVPPTTGKIIPRGPEASGRALDAFFAVGRVPGSVQPAIEEAKQFVRQAVFAALLSSLVPRMIDSIIRGTGEESGLPPPASGSAAAPDESGAAPTERVFQKRLALVRLLLELGLAFGYVMVTPLGRKKFVAHVAEQPRLRAAAVQWLASTPLGNALCSDYWIMEGRAAQCRASGVVAPHNAEWGGGGVDKILPCASVDTVNAVLGQVLGLLALTTSDDDPPVDLTWRRFSTMIDDALESIQKDFPFVVTLGGSVEHGTAVALDYDVDLRVEVESAANLRFLHTWMQNHLSQKAHALFDPRSIKHCEKKKCGDYRWLEGAEGGVAVTLDGYIGRCLGGGGRGDLPKTEKIQSSFSLLPAAFPLPALTLGESGLRKQDIGRKFLSAPDATHISSPFSSDAALGRTTLFFPTPFIGPSSSPLLSQQQENAIISDANFFKAYVASPFLLDLSFKLLPQKSGSAAGVPPVLPVALHAEAWKFVRAEGVDRDIVVFQLLSHHPNVGVFVT